MSGYYGYELNWLGIALASLAPLVVGAIWYHPKVFGQMWMDALGFKEEDLRKGNMAVLFGVTFLMSFTLAYYFACLLYTSPSPRDLSTSRMPSSA